MTMKIFTTKQIAELDKYTIEKEPISDLDLMERASLQITNWLIQQASNEQKMIFFAGPGNNGGDAMAIARQLAELDYSCELYLLDFGKELKFNQWYHVTAHYVKGEPVIYDIVEVK